MKNEEKSKKTGWEWNDKLTSMTLWCTLPTTMSNTWSINIYTYMKKTFVRYLLNSRWSDRCETLHMNRVGRGHENSQGPMSIALC